MNSPLDFSSPKQRQLGLFAALGAYLWWGVVTVVYLKYIKDVKALEIMGHRIFWSLVVLLVIITARGQLGALVQTIRSRRKALVLFTTALLISINWYVFILAAERDQLIQASLGYFSTPLVNVALGMVFLGERMRPLQWVAIALGVISVCVLGTVAGAFPWIAITLALTFGFYGLLRKKVNVDSAVGLTIECLMILPLGIAILANSWADPDSSFNELYTARDYPMLFWLTCAGLVTAIPLLMFGFAARRLMLITLGMIQYLGPTCQWLMAVCVYHEELSRIKLAAFVLIWLGLIVYSVDMIHYARSARRLNVAF